MRDLVSIIIPAFNAQAYIVDCLKSCASQVLDDNLSIEILVINDQSTDRTVDLVVEYAQKCPFPLRLLHNEKNSGPAATRNAGMLAADGNFIAFIDSDDMMYPDRLISQVDMLKELYAGICFGGVTDVDESGGIIRNVVRPFPSDLEKIKSMMVLDELHTFTSTVMIKKEVLERIGMFNQDLIHFEDYEFFFRCCEVYTPVYVQSPISYKRVFGKSMSFTVSYEDFVHSREYFFKLLTERDHSLDRLKKKFWAKQYFGLARIAQGRGEIGPAIKFYAKSLYRGKLIALLGMCISLLPKNIQKNLASRKWRR